MDKSGSSSLAIGPRFEPRSDIGRFVGRFCRLRPSCRCAVRFDENPVHNEEKEQQDKRW